MKAQAKWKVNEKKNDLFKGNDENQAPTWMVGEGGRVA